MAYRRASLEERKQAQRQAQKYLAERKIKNELAAFRQKLFESGVCVQKHRFGELPDIDW